MVPVKFRYCPYCGHRFTEINIKARSFCAFCGKKLNMQKSSLSKKLSCAVCHKSLDWGINNQIRCPFCGIHFHRNCITSWLLDYNSCPLCLNIFLLPKTINYSR